MSKIAIIDFGSQFTQLIAKRIREMCVYSEIFSPEVAFEKVASFDAFILSGGPQSVVLPIPQLILDIMNHNDLTLKPVLGICYGLQMIASYFGAGIDFKSKKEFGRVRLEILTSSRIIDHVYHCGSLENEVWMSHSDSLTESPQGFKVIARSVVSHNIAIIENEERLIYGTQFHPEVTHTLGGRKLLSNFLDIAKCERTWKMELFLNDEIIRIRSIVGNKKVIAAVSGGVDSSVAATLTHRAIGNNLHCFFIDTGLLRKNEAENVRELLVDRFAVPVSFIDRSNLFLSRLRDVVDPEQKRLIIGRTFIEVFESEAQKFDDADFLMQGTLYPDIIESGCASDQAGTKIKSHHNVGGLPKHMNLKLLEPLKALFKDEVRVLGRELGLPDALVMRHPFPGPGLAIRILGAVDRNKVKILQEVDNILINTMKNFDLYDDIWQAFSVLLPVKSVGVMGDGRTYNNVCALRAVTSVDGMTADAFPFENKELFSLRFWDFLQNVAAIIVNNVKGISRVVYDITSKPPATIEWE